MTRNKTITIHLPKTWDPLVQPLVHVGDVATFYQKRLHVLRVQVMPTIISEVSNTIVDFASTALQCYFAS